MKLYVTSLSGNARWALEEGNVVAVCYSGPSPLDDAKSYGRDHTKATDEPTWIYEVEIAHQGAFKVEKAVTFVSGN